MLDIWGNGWYYNTRSAPVAQLDRVSDYESEGREFESLPAHQGNLLNGKLPFLFYIHLLGRFVGAHTVRPRADASIGPYSKNGILAALVGKIPLDKRRFLLYIITNEH